MTLPRPIKELLQRRIDDGQIASVWQRVRERRQGRPRARRVVLGLSGVSLALAGLLVWMHLMRPPVEPLRLADREPIGILEAPRQVRTIDINDGSQIVLSRGARLETVDNEERVFGTTLVRGRAEFEVRPGGRRRWLVHAGHVTVEVVGTHFIVDRSTTSVSIAVTRGEVMVRGERVDGGARRLRVGESLQVDDRAGPEAAPVPDVEPSAALSPADAGVTSTAVAPLPLPYQIAARRISGADPHLPAAVKRRLRGQPDQSFVTQICVDKSGVVTDVSLLQGIAGADESLLATMRHWRYAPQPIPVCFVTQLVFAIE